MKIKKPVFIIGCPRSGTTLLHAILKTSPDLWSYHTESHFVWENYVPYKNDITYAVYLTDKDCKEKDREELEARYSERVYKNNFFSELTKYLFYNRFNALMKPFYWLWRKTLATLRSNSKQEYRVLDKTPPNTYRVGFLAEAFPDAKFIYITRDGITNISSLISGWNDEERFAFKFREANPENKDINIEGYHGKVWKFTHAPGWKEYLNSKLEEVCAFQWLSAHKHTQEAFEKIDSTRIMQLKYEDLVANPAELMKEVCEFSEIEFSGKVKKNSEALPVVSTNSKPDPKKWLKNKDRLEKIADKIKDMQESLGYTNLLKEHEANQSTVSA